MALTFAQARTLIDNYLPQTAPSYATIRDSAIQKAVRIASPRVDEQTWQDFTAKDAVTSRYALTGRNVRLMEAADQIAPTGLNVSGVIAPTTAPTLTTSGSGSTFTAGLWYAAYSYVTALGETQISPLRSVTLTAGQNIVTGVLTLPTNVTSINWYLSTAVFNAVVQQKSTGATGAAQTFTGPAVAGTSPLINYTALSTLRPGMLEPGVNVDGTPLSTVTTLNLGTPPAAGAKFRVRFSRIAVPPVNASDVIGVPDEWIDWVATWLCCQGLMLAHQGGDTTRYGQVADKLEPFVMDFLAKSAGRAKPLPRWTPWV